MRTRYGQPEGLPEPLGHYSHVAVVPGLLFVAGQVAVDEAGATVGAGDFEAQMRQVYGNLERALASEGAAFEDVAKFTTFLAREENIDAFYKVRRALYPALFPKGRYPANTLVVVDRLVREEFLIEVEAVAALAG
jgi:enamine deaminase RidA (YjgF/YER057c/UK114 family)